MRFFRRLFGRWFVRLALVALLVAVFAVQGWFGAVASWALFGYLLFRAFPGIRKDFRFLWRGIPRRSAPTSGNARF